MHFRALFQIFPKMGKIYDNFALLGKKYALKGPILAFSPLFSPFSLFLFPFSPFLSIFFFFPFFFFLFFFPKHEFFISPPLQKIFQFLTLLDAFSGHFFSKFSLKWGKFKTILLFWGKNMHSRALF